ncbi:hypothetical protein DIT68_05415 [Brumimicrobium oceani]|uniref:DUF7033 domain-containing protein n=2 Tax=Brumimicrobium oceani TaxID=2100725 RepID=A0A2U2XDY3_9FLAO|nr:hypothetical protein DIT68_05415 [Brumimicrobium oceani]
MSLIFEDRNIEYQLLNDVKSFKDAPLPKLAYSEDRVFDEDATLYPSTILFEEEIISHLVDKTEWNGEEILSIDGIPDVIGSIFYVISLYDDFTNEETDEHDRNIGSKSLLYKMKWLNKLVVERWSELFISFIETQNACTLNPKEIPFNIIPSFDIDNVYAYRLKKGWRKYMSIAKDLLKYDKFRLKERKEVLAGFKKDPYDTYEIIEGIANSGFDVKVFWLLGEYSTYDRNVDYENENHRRLISEVNEYADVGLHPSYQSNKSRVVLRDEKARIEDILGEEISSTRQHFLKVKLPYTFEDLEKVGFTDDYSLGYADQIGFRAGIARPFTWFNLKENRPSKLRLHPISYMDGTLNEYMELNVEEAIKVVKNLKKEVRIYGGNFVALWHNETIGNNGKWKNWSRVLEETLKKD